MEYDDIYVFRPVNAYRNLENSSAMKGQSNGVRGFSSPARDQDKRGNHHNANSHHHNNDNKSASSETAHDSKKGGGSSSAGSEAVPPIWPPKFVIALTNKEKEEDFMAIKGSKLPQRPKKRAKFIQRTLNVSLRPALNFVIVITITVLIPLFRVYIYMSDFSLFVGSPGMHLFRSTFVKVSTKISSIFCFFTLLLLS